MPTLSRRRLDRVGLSDDYEYMKRKFTFVVDEFYHVYNRGIEKRNIFLSKKDYERFLALLYLSNNIESLHLSDFQHKARQDIFTIIRGDTLTDIGAYCLMPNHFHLLLRERSKGGISTFIQKLCTAYSMFFNKKYGRSGGLFTRPFKAVHITKDKHLQYLFAYIHLNPLELVDKNWENHVRTNGTQEKNHLMSYGYSSYLDYTRGGRAQASILTKKPFPRYFNSMADFKNYVDDWVDIRKSGEFTKTVKASP